MFYFAFEYHLQYELSKSPFWLFVILPNLREKKTIFTHACIYCRIMPKVSHLQLMIELGLCTKQNDYMKYTNILKMPIHMILVVQEYGQDCPNKILAKI